MISTHVAVCRLQFVGSGGSTLRKQSLPKSMVELATEIGRERWTLSPGRPGGLVEMVQTDVQYVNIFYMGGTPKIGVPPNHPF